MSLAVALGSHTRTHTPTGTWLHCIPFPQCAVIQRNHSAPQYPAHVSAASREVRAKCSIFLKMQQRFHYLAHIKLRPNDPLLMLKCIDLLMKVFFCAFPGHGGVCRLKRQMKIEAVLFCVCHDCVSLCVAGHFV